MLLLYFITNLLVLYGSRIREYYADREVSGWGIDRITWPQRSISCLLAMPGCPRKQYKKVEGVKSFFINDPSRALTELKELKEVDTDMSGTIDTNELEALRIKSVRLGTADKLTEFFSTHPNMLKRIKRLSSLLYEQPW